MPNQEFFEAVEKDPAVLRAAALLQYALMHETSSIEFQPGSPSLRVVWFRLRKEVHELICTNSEKYTAERTLMGTTAKPAVAALSALLTRDFGLEVASASALASLALFLPLRMTVNAWCAAANEGEAEVVKREIDTLEQLGSNAEREQ